MRAHQILQRFFERKQKFNPGYSLRALARDLDLSPSYVSGMLRGTKSFPVGRFQQITEKLELDELASQRLSEALIEKSIEQKLGQKTISLIPRRAGEKRALKAADRYQELSRKQYGILAHWHTIALLDLITCSDFQMDEAWICRRLGISPDQLQASIDCLVQQKLIQKADGRWKKSRKKVRFPTRQSQEVVREFHRQMIELALKELLNRTAPASFENRLIAGVTFAANPKQLGKARRVLNRALYEVSEILTQGECTEVYQVNAQLFPITSSSARPDSF